MRKWKQLCLVFALTFIIALFRTITEKEDQYIPEIYDKYTATINPKENFSNLGVEEKHYQKDGVTVSYPQFVSGAKEDRLEIWNQMIEEDVNKIIDIYAFQPFPQAGPAPTSEPTSTLTIRYEIKNLGDISSIFYKAAFSSKYSAHPTDLVYTTNLDLANNKRLVLSDLVKVDSAFVQGLSKWEMIPAVKGDEEYTKAVWDYLQGLGDKALLKGFQTADIIGAGNYLGIFSYLTSDRLGLSIAMPNYLGDHVEFEMEYSQLDDALLRELP